MSFLINISDRDCDGEEVEILTGESEKVKKENIK